MKKTIILFLLFTAANSYGQYFGEKTTYLTNTDINSGPPPYAYYSTFKHLQLINQDSIQENYIFWKDTINGFSPFAKPEIRQLNVRNDSIFVNDQLIFIKNLSQGDSFSLTMGPGETVFYIDSVYMANGIKQTQFTINKKFNFPGFYGDFLWVDGVGEITLGLVDFLEYGLIIINLGLSYKAYCKDNSNPKNMDGSDWTETEDDCMFESYIAERRRRTNVDLKLIDEIKCYPNPAKDKLFIEGVNIEFYRIINTSGQEILSGQYQDAIDISLLSMGVYFIEVIVNENVIRSRFIVK
jgi:hypothetical protein